MLIKAILSILTVICFANEGPPPPAENKAPEAPEWALLEAKVAELKSKINSKEESLKKNFVDKRNAKTPEEAKTVVADIQKEHKELNQLLEEYEKARSQLFFQYPDRLKKKGGEIKKLKPENIEVLQQRLDVNAKLDEVGKKIEKTYQKKVKKSKNQKSDHDEQKGKKSEEVQSDEGLFKTIEIKK